MLPSGMAQPRKRPAVTVTLDPQVLDATRELLASMPGADVTLSRLVDELLRDFVRRMTPMVQELRRLAEKERVDPVEALAVLDAAFGRTVAELGQGYAAARTEWEPKKGE